jgi:aspartate/methionine/tyrosine aminotransferase
LNIGTEIGAGCDVAIGVSMKFNSNVMATEMPPMVELARRALELAEGGADVIRVDQGAVDVVPPAAFMERVTASMSDPAVHRYAPDPGLPGLRAALARYGADRFGVEWDPDTEIVATPGANQACFAALLAIAGPGDEVLLPAPWYFNHAMVVTAIGAVPVPVPTKSEDGFIPTSEAVSAAITPKTRALALVNPNNPTGVVYPDESIEELIALAIEHDLWVLADQTYHDLCFAGSTPLSPAAVPRARERVVTVCSFSKSLGLAGWRLGFVAGSPELVDQILKIQDCSVISAARSGQEGLLAALPGIADHTARVRTELVERRDRLVNALRAEHLDRFVEPEGSLFLFLRLPGGGDSLAFCQRLLEEKLVVAVPGSAFGTGGEGSIRISFGSASGAQLKEAVQRIAVLTESLRS